MTHYIIDEYGNEIFSNQAFTKEYFCNGNVSLGNSEIFTINNCVMSAETVILPKGSLLKLLGSQPEVMVAGILPE